MMTNTEAAELCRQAEAAIEEEDTDKAYVLIEKVLRFIPSYFPARLLRARLYVTSGAAEGAEEEVEETLLGLTPEQQHDDLIISRILALRGMAVLEQGRFPEAILILREALLCVEAAKTTSERRGDFLVELGGDDKMFDPEKIISDIKLVLADALESSGRVQEAADMLAEIIKFAEDPTEAYIQLARLHERIGNYRMAAECWSEAGEDYEWAGNASARAEISIEYLMEANDAEAVEDDGEVVDPGDSSYDADPRPRPLKITYLGLAITHAHASAALDPSSHGAQTMLSTLCDKINLPKLRLIYAERAADLVASYLAEAPASNANMEDMLSALLCAAIAFSEVGQHDRALIYTSAAHNAMPDSVEAALIHSSTLDALGRHEQAIAILGMTRTFNPANAQLPAQLGEALHAAGRPEDARAVLAEAASIAADQPEQIQWVAISYARIGDWDAAVRYIIHAAECATTGSAPLRLKKGDYRTHALAVVERFNRNNEDREARAQLLACLSFAAQNAELENASKLFIVLLYPLPDGPGPYIEDINNACLDLDALMLNNG